MFTYQVRRRTFRTSDNRSPKFPAEGTITFVFSPKQAFGAEGGGGRTAVRGVPATILFNANTGEHSVQSTEPLSPLDVELDEPDRKVRLKGNTLAIVQRFESSRELETVIEGVYFGLPALLNVEFADPPLFDQVEGSVDGVNFRWELSPWTCEVRTTTQAEQENRFAESWTRMGLLSLPANARLFAALHFFYVAVRLCREARTPGEFLAEALLNFAKVLEVLFPAEGDGKTRDSVRRGLTKLGFTEEEVEADYLPAMALRNEISVGHVNLALFEAQQLEIVHLYAGRAESVFHELLHRVLARTQEGSFRPAPYEGSAPRPEALTVIDRLARYRARYGG